ncbi:hypothetical protein TNCV_594941 [Trichonephila clavipes]|nr:hypothetical protein TNCV_594941 [Trichonephila clavipes]
MPSTPQQREDVRASTYSTHIAFYTWVFSGTKFELMTVQPRFRYLDHYAVRPDSSKCVVNRSCSGMTPREVLSDLCGLILTGESRKDLAGRNDFV